MTLDPLHRTISISSWSMKNGPDLSLRVTVSRRRYSHIADNARLPSDATKEGCSIQDIPKVVQPSLNSVLHLL